MRGITIPAVVALLIAMTFQLAGCGGVADAYEGQVSNVQYTSADVADFINSTSDVTVSFPDGVVSEQVITEGAPADDISRILTLSSKTSNLPANATIEQRREYIKRELEERLTRDVLYTDPGTNKIMKESLIVYMTANPNIINDMNRDLGFYRGLANTVHSDIPIDAWYGQYIALSIYGGVITGYEDGTFRGNQPVTIAEFAAILSRSTLYADDLVQVRSNIERDYRDGRGSGYYGWTPEKQWWLVNWASVSIWMPSTVGLEYNINKPAVTAYPSSHMTRGDVALAIAKKYFGGELRDLVIQIGGDEEGNGRTAIPANRTFADATKINEKTTMQAMMASWIQNANSYGYDGVVRYTPFELYRECIANPKNGVPAEYLAALIILRDVGIMEGRGNNMSAWNAPVTRAEAVTFMFRMGEYIMNRNADIS